MKPAPLLAVAAAALGIMTACSTSADPLPPRPSSSAPALDNCGFEVPADASSERIFTMKSSTAELVLALGLEDRLVAAAALDAPLPHSGTTAQIIDGVPSHEALLALAPDLVFAGWESNVSAEGAGDRQRLLDAGITTYVAPAACQDPAYAPNPMTFDLLFDQIAEAGTVLGASEAADELIATQKAELASITADDRGLSVLWYSSGTDTPFIGAGIGVPQLLMESAGLVNIAADIEEAWISMSWEEVVNREPDVIILVDSQWNTAANKAERLATDPLLKSLPAVQEERFITIDFPATEAGVRNVAALASIIEQLKAIP